MQGAAFRVPPAESETKPVAPPPSFSVVIAAHNAGATIADAVESALTQTLKPLEVIVGDDGSTDGTALALEAYWDQIRYFRQEHRGVGSAWNAALALAQGEFFAVLGADDVYLPERLEALAALSVARPDLDLLCTDLLYDVDGRDVGRFEASCPFEINDQRAAILERCFCAAPAMRVSSLIRVGGFDESMRTGSDWDCAIRLIHSGAAAGLVAEPLYRYRIHDMSLTADRIATLGERVEFLERLERTLLLREHERSALTRSIARHRGSLVLAEAEAALRSRGPDARKRALAVARTPDLRLPIRAAALAAVLAPRAAARTLERREGRHGDNRLRRPLPHR